MTEKEIVDDIKKSKKYKGLYSKTVERIAIDCIKRFGEKRAEKEAKNLLHQIWGAFYSSRPDFSKILEKINDGLQSGKGLKEIILPILKLQSSVDERVPILDNFYKKIFEVTGIPNSIIDHACALNPLTIPWMNLPEDAIYKAYDIDEDQNQFLNSAFNLLGIKNAKVEAGDILIDNFEYADVVFMLKLLPCLEHQKKGSGLEVLKNQKFKYAVVSFPIKSIGGKEKGMADFYGNSFKNMVQQEKWDVKELLFDTELVFIVKK